MEEKTIRKNGYTIYYYRVPGTGVYGIKVIGEQLILNIALQHLYADWYIMKIEKELYKNNGTRIRHITTIESQKLRRNYESLKKAVDTILSYGVNDN